MEVKKGIKVVGFKKLTSAGIKAKELINISGSGTVNSSRKTKTLTAIIKRVKKGNLLDRL